MLKKYVQYKWVVHPQKWRVSYALYTDSWADLTLQSGTMVWIARLKSLRGGVLKTLMPLMDKAVDEMEFASISSPERISYMPTTYRPLFHSDKPHTFVCVVFIHPEKMWETLALCWRLQGRQCWSDSRLKPAEILPTTGHIEVKFNADIHKDTDFVALLTFHVVQDSDTQHFPVTSASPQIIFFSFCGVVSMIPWLPDSWFIFYSKETGWQDIYQSDRRLNRKESEQPRNIWKG